MPKLKIKEAGSFSKYERQKLQRLYTHGAPAYGSVLSLTKTSRLPVSKVRQFLHSKDSYTKFTLAARKFKRMTAFARFRNEIWCMDHAYVDKLAKENNGVKFLLVRQDLFDRTVKAKGMKTKDSQEIVKAFSSMITKRNRPKKIWVDKKTEFAGVLKKFCAAEGIQVYPTMSDPKAAFAERTIRSLKYILYRYMEDYGYKYIHKLPQFITTLNSRTNSSIDMRLKTVKNCDFKSILHSKPLREIKKPTFKIGDRVRISKYDLLFHKGYKPQFTREVFEMVAIATKKPPTYTDNTLSSFTNFLPEQVNLEGQWEVANSEISYPTMYQNLTEGKFKFFDEKLSKTTSTYSIKFGLYTSITKIVEAMNTLIQDKNYHNETCITVNVSRRTQKVVIMLANDNSGLAFCSTDLRHIFGDNVRNELGVLMIRKGPHETEFAYDIVRIHSLMIYSDIVEYNIVRDTKAPLLRCSPFISKLKGGEFITAG